MRILVLGAGGMAGHVIALHLKERGYVVDTLSAHHPLDANTHLINVLDLRSLQTFLHANTYDAVINCIGLLVKQSEQRKDLATYLNAYLPHFLENHYKDTSTKVIHLSTDGVFSGKATSYTEDEICDGEDFYGRSKMLGEIVNDKDLTIRMSIIGPDLRKTGQGLFNWFFQQKGEIKSYSKVLWDGVTTLELAKGIEAALRQNVAGLLHFAPGSAISKSDLLQLCQQIFSRTEVHLRPVDEPVFERILLNTRTDFRFTIPNYESMLQEMKRWIDSHENIYPQYFSEKT